MGVPLVDKFRQWRKAGVSATDAAGLATIFGKTAAPRRSTKDLLQAYSTQPWLRGVVNRVTHTTAAVPWHVYAVKRQGKFVSPGALKNLQPTGRRRAIKQLQVAGELTELPNHPAALLLDVSNPYLTGLVIRQLTHIYIDVVGDSFWLLEKNQYGMPVQVWPVPPHWVKKLATPGHPVYEIEVGDRTEEVPATEILRFSSPDPVNPYLRGSGIAQALDDELQTDEYAAKFTKAWFYNSARPDLIITPSNDIGESSIPEFRRLEQAWLQRHQSFWRAFKPFFSSKKIDVHQLQPSFQSMQLLELRRYQRDLIQQVYGLPPEMLGIIENANRATIEAADYLMQRYVVAPRLEQMRAVLQARLMPLFDERLVIDYDNPVIEDKEFKLKVAEKSPWALRVHEWRDMMGYEPLNDEKVNNSFMVPIGVRLVEDLLDLLTEPTLDSSADPMMTGPGPSQGEPEDMEDPEMMDDTDEEDDDKNTAAEAHKRLQGYAKTADPGEIVTDSLFRIAARYEAQMRRDFLNAVRATRSAVDAQALEDALRSGMTEAAVKAASIDTLGEQLTPDSEATLRDATVRAGEEAAKALASALGVDIAFDKKNPAAELFARNKAADMVTGVTDEARKAVRSVVVRSVSEGIAPADAARLIRDIVGLDDRRARAVANFAARLVNESTDPAVARKRVANYAESQLRRRGLAIARTEIMGAANMGQQILWNQAAREGHIRADKSRKVWITAHDDRLDEVICEPMPYMEANQHVGLSGKFTTGKGATVLQPPAHVQCRCTTGLRIEE